MKHPILKAAVTLSLLTATGWAAMTGNTINVTTGATITRTWDEIKNAGYTYAPMQTYTASSSATKVYLPYDNTDGVYYDLQTIGFDNFSGNRTFMNNNAPTPCSLTYGLLFDTTITGFSLSTAAIYVDLDSNYNNLASIDYSTSENGTWHNLWSTTIDGFYMSIISQAANLNTKELYLRYSTSGTPENGGFMFAYTTGTTDSYESFVGNMITLTVVPEPAALSLLALGGLALLRRRPRT